MQCLKAPYREPLRLPLVLRGSASPLVAAGACGLAPRSSLIP